ncbi:hypothetical protein RDABS01_008532 [Bienertia sinuspersici]
MYAKRWGIMGRNIGIKKERKEWRSKINDQQPINQQQAQPLSQTINQVGMRKVMVDEEGFVNASKVKRSQQMSEYKTKTGFEALHSNPSVENAQEEYEAYQVYKIAKWNCMDFLRQKEKDEWIVGDDEIKDAFWSIPEEKAPRTDGYGSKFFKAAWDVIGLDINKAVEEFFLKGKTLRVIRSAAITLIPKVQCPFMLLNTDQTMLVV